MQSSEPIIQLVGLGKEFRTSGGPIKALDDINLTICQGEVFGIIGLSGAGKSTLVRCINYLEVPTSGEVLFENRSLASMSRRDQRKARQSMGMIFQQFNLLAQRNVIQNVCFPLEIAGAPKKEARERAMELLGLVGLADRKDAYPSQLSGGQKQRLCIARTLLKHPKVLIFDDSTSAVDTATDAKIRAELAKLSDMTKIIIAQRVSSVMDADQIVILEDGKIHAAGKHRELLETDPIYQELYYSQQKGGEDDGETV